MSRMSLGNLRPMPSPRTGSPSALLIDGTGGPPAQSSTEEPPGLSLGSWGKNADLFTGILDPYPYCVIETQRHRYCNSDGSGTSGQCVASIISGSVSKSLTIASIAQENGLKGFLDVLVLILVVRV